MKISTKSFRLVFMFVALVAMQAFVSSCGNSSKKQNLQQIREEVAAVKTQCPIDMGIAGTVTDVDIDETSGTVRYTLQPNELFLNESVFVDHKDLMRKSLLLNISPFESEKSGLTQLAEAGLNVAYVYSFPSGKQHTLLLTPDDILNGSGEKLSPSERANAVLETRCEISRLIFPTKIDDYTSQIGVELTPENMIHQFSIDEKGLGLPISDPAVSRDALYNSLVDGLKLSAEDRTMKAEMEAVIATGRGLIYHYTGVPSGATIEVPVTLETLRTIFK